MPSVGDSAGLRRVLLFSTIEGNTATALMSFLGGTFLTAFMLRLGASAWQVGLVAALGPMTQVGQVFTAFFVEREESPRLLAVWMLGLHRVVWAAAGLIALMLSPRWNVTAFMVMYTVAWLTAAPGVTAWQSLMTEVVPDQMRGRYFGNRWTANTVFSAVALLAAGWVVDTFPGRDGLAVLYSLGMLLAILNWHLLTRLPDLRQPRSAASYWEHLRRPLQDRRFRIVAWWLPAWTFVQLAVLPFYTLTMAGAMGLSYSLISVLTVTTSLASAFCFPLWGRLIDRRGPFLPAASTAAGASLVPLLWLVADRGGFWYLLVLHALLGASTAGLQTLTLQMSMKLAPPEHRAGYLAIINGANGLAGFLGPVTAGLLAEVGRFDLIFGGAGLVGLVLAGVWQYRLRGEYRSLGALRGQVSSGL